MTRRSDPEMIGLQHAYWAEHEAALLYGALAVLEEDETKRDALEELAQEELAHAQHWADELATRGMPLPEQPLSFSARVLLWMAQRLGIRAVVPFLARREGKEAARYNVLLRHPDLRLEERRHEQVLRALARGDDAPLAVDPWSDDEGFNLRAAVFGVNDGLVSNLSLTAGLAGAQVEPLMIILGGAAGLLSGALSMAGGEYLSVRSQREVMDWRFEQHKSELDEAPEGALRLLTDTYKSRGVPGRRCRARCPRPARGSGSRRPGRRRSGLPVGGGGELVHGVRCGGEHPAASVSVHRGIWAPTQPLLQRVHSGGCRCASRDSHREEFRLQRIAHVDCGGSCSGGDLPCGADLRHHSWWLTPSTNSPES